jgi:pimeloyl-ACP methyl ester carboxylesterase
LPSAPISSAGSSFAPLAGQAVLDMIGDGLHGEDPEKVGWPIDPHGATLEERFPVMFCNDMNPSEREAFMAKVGGDMWPARSYSHTDWSYDHLDAVPATYVVCLRDNILPVEWQKKFAERFRCDRVVQIDAGHQAMDTRPHGVAEILRNESAVERSGSNGQSDRRRETRRTRPARPIDSCDRSATACAQRFRRSISVDSRCIPLRIHFLPASTCCYLV